MKYALNISPRNNTEGLANYCYRILYDNILQLRLPPNTIINEAEIATALGVSRTPVHEAVSQLKEETLIDVMPRKESRVSRISLPQVCEGVFIRASLEPKVVQQIIGKVSPDMVARMEENLATQKEILDSKVNTSRFYHYDRAFHRLLFEAAGRTYSHELSRMVNLHSLRVSYLIEFDQSFFETIEGTSWDEHRLLLDVIKGEHPLDFDLDQLLYNHIARFQNFFEPYVEHYPDFFTFTEEE